MKSISPTIYDIIFNKYNRNVMKMKKMDTLKLKYNNSNKLSVC